MNLGILFQVNNSVRCYSAAAKLQPITPVLRTPGWVPVRPVDSQPVRPRLHPTRSETTSEPGASGWSMMARVLAWLSIITLMICGLGWQRAGHARNEYQLSRQLAKAEQREVVLYRNHNVITAGMAQDMAALKQQVVEQDYLLAKVTASKRGTRPMQAHLVRPETRAAVDVRPAMYQRPVAPAENSARTRSTMGSSPLEVMGPRSSRPVTKL